MRGQLGELGLDDDVERDDAQAGGAGTIIMQQASDNGQLGKWTIVTPDGRTYIVHRGEYMEKIQTVVEGTYAVTVESPNNAQTFTKVYIDNGIILKTDENYITFSVHTGANVRVVMTHRTDKPADESRDYIRVELSSDKNEVLPGETVNYTLNVSNLTLTTLRDIKASVQVDQDTRKDWVIPYIYSGQTWSTQFNYIVSGDMKEGETIAMITDISSPKILSAGIKQEHVIAQVGVPILPETGWQSTAIIVSVLAGVSLLSAISIRRRQYVLQTA